ncbi:hypothetical protein BpHYR1_024420 [Brachionus plicatilis]|uniref:Uncharacterized protein n=1 Tax=Brachionus plicatilis TaxID=10195 RepID=A0A3M7QHJ8_BRAPC|nr:hypothetical protein BpHYR1_024420 [Brachionus plicatilis]
MSRFLLNLSIRCLIFTTFESFCSADLIIEKISKKLLKKINLKPLDSYCFKKTIVNNVENNIVSYVFLVSSVIIIKDIYSKLTSIFLHHEFSKFNRLIFFCAKIRYYFLS